MACKSCQYFSYTTIDSGSSYLGEGGRVDLVLASDLDTDGVVALGVVASLGTSLNVGVDLLVVRSSNDAQVLGTSDGCGVGGRSVASGGGVASDGGLVDVVTGLSTDEETLVADNSVKDGADVTRGTTVNEGAGVGVGLLEGQVELLSTLGRRIGVPQVLDLSLDGLGEELGKLNLGVEESGSSPSLSNGNTWFPISQVYFLRKGRYMGLFKLRIRKHIFLFRANSTYGIAE